MSMRMVGSIAGAGGLIGFVLGIGVSAGVHVLGNNARSPTQVASTETVSAPASSWPHVACDGMGGSWNMNGTQYHVVEKYKGYCEWEVDREAMRLAGEYERHRREMWVALQTRVVTDAEMMEILQYGNSINIEELVPYNVEEKQRERGTAFVIQAQLRAAAASTPTHQWVGDKK